MFKRQKKNINFLTDVGDFINKGGFSLVFKSVSDENKIYRIEQTIQTNRVKRETSIHEFLYNSTTSPCYPELFETYELSFDDLPQRITSLFDRKKSKMVHVTMMEKGELGSIQTTKEHISRTEFVDITFMLYWSLYTSNSLFGFMHRDLKPGNIVLKRKDTNDPIIFKLKDNEWIIRTSIIPMIIDFGRASMLNTRLEEKYWFGTMSFMSPESVSYRLLLTKTVINLYGNNYYKEIGYDIWGMTMTLLSINLSTSMLTAGFKMSQELSKYKSSDVIRFIRHDDLHTDDDDDQLHTDRSLILLLTICVFQKAIGNGIFPPDELIGTVYSKFIFNNEFKERLDRFDEIYKLSLVYKKFLSKKPQQLVSTVFRKSLSWDPNTRAWNGRFYEIFRYIKQFDYVNDYTPYTAQERLLFEFSQDQTFKTKQMNLLNEQKYIQSQICEKCGDEKKEKFICLCCSKIFCDDQCQHK